MAFQPYIKLNINRWRQDQNNSYRDEIIIDNKISIDIDFNESVAPSRNSFQITIYNFAQEKDFNLTEGRDRVKIEMGYKDETDTFVFEGVVSKLNYSNNQEEKLCSFELVDGDDILEYPVTINEKPGKNKNGSDEIRLSVYAILVRALPKIQRDMNRNFKKEKKPELQIQDNLKGKEGELDLFDPGNVVRNFTSLHFQATGSFRDVLNTLLLGTGYGFYISNNGDYRKLCFFNKGQTQKSKEKYLSYDLNEDSGFLNLNIKATKTGSAFEVQSIFLPLLRAGDVIRITRKSGVLFLVVTSLKVSGNNYKDGLICHFMGVEL